MRHRNWFVGTLALLLAAGPGLATAGQVAKKAVETSDPPPVHGFSVALVLGDMQGTSPPETLSTGAKKALADLREFLPFKSYRLLDTQWILCCGGTKAGQTWVSGRLRGLDEQQYAFFVDVASTGPKLSLHFSLREDALAPKVSDTKPPDAQGKTAGKDADQMKNREKELLEAILAEERKSKTGDQATIKDIESRLEKLNRENPKARTVSSGKNAVIDSTFSMDVGETVVIGTSSLKGDKALIAVLTAVRRPASQSSTLGEKR